MKCVLISLNNCVCLCVSVCAARCYRGQEEKDVQDFMHQAFSEAVMTEDGKKKQ